MTFMLYYLGYLTIEKEEFGSANLVIPNKMMREIYSEYFLKVINEETDFDELKDLPNLRKYTVVAVEIYVDEI